MFVQNIDPVLLTIGPLAVRWYGLVYALGFLAFYFVLRRHTEYSEREADSLLVWLIVGLLLGARTFHFAFYRPDLFSLGEFFAVWHGGMSFHGALLGLGVAGWLWSRKHEKDFWALADLSAVVAAFFLALGRVANFVNSEIVGTVTDAAWCVEFPKAQGSVGGTPLSEGCRHPAQLYAVVKDLLIGAALIPLYRRSFTPGFVFWSFAALYAVLRFVVNLFRADPVLFWGWVKMGHVLSVALLAIAAWVLASKHRDDIKKLL